MSALLDLANLDLASQPNTLPPTSPSDAAAAAVAALIPTTQFARTVQGVHTELLLQLYGDRIFLLVTQLGRIGALIQVNPPPASIPAPIASTPSSLFPSLPPVHPSMTLTPLFGAPPDAHAGLLHDLYALQAGAICWRNTEEGFPNRPVLLGIALKRARAAESGEDEEEGGVSEVERELFGEVMSMVEEACESVGL